MDWDSRMCYQSYMFSVSNLASNRLLHSLVRVEMISENMCTLLVYIQSLFSMHQQSLSCTCFAPNWEESPWTCARSLVLFHTLWNKFTTILDLFLQRLSNTKISIINSNILSETCPYQGNSLCQWHRNDLCFHALGLCLN